jgi:hypothetical protein
MKTKEELHVLVISHNAFSLTSNMGKTLNAYFNNWNSKNVAQLYFHSERPTVDTAAYYYQITDVEMLNSLLSRREFGKIYNDKIIKNDIRQGSMQNKCGNTIKDLFIRKIYQLGRKRTSIIYIMRNLLWKYGRWNNCKLHSWIKNFSPDVIFFASGDYEFSYDIALSIAKYQNIPIITIFFDDYYMIDKKGLGEYVQKKLIHKATIIAKQSSIRITLNEKMNECYNKLFYLNCNVLYKGAEHYIFKNNMKDKNISYLGGISLGRNQQLIEIGRALIELRGKLTESEKTNFPASIDVYSAETRKDLLQGLNEKNGIIFHGAISSQEVQLVQQKSTLLIYVESFDSRIRERTRYSLSTKIPESLACGTCLFAYGPSDIASMEYLQKHYAACIVNNKEQLPIKLQEILLSKTLRCKIVENARNLAKRNHDLTHNAAMLKQWLYEVYREYNVNENITN